MQGSSRYSNISELVMELDQLSIYRVVPSFLLRHKLLYKVYVLFLDFSESYLFLILSLSQIFMKGMKILGRNLILQGKFL